ncbi:RNA polymerase sigma factor [Marinibacterium sp. SX1]|uniref:RNA polymerase sigma factor n=1 Tax=Marinibacterium sp. SX1 TaxID=3388424 RepID=UPI003D186C3E
MDRSLGASDPLAPCDAHDLLNRAIEMYYTDIARAAGHRPGSRTERFDVVHDLYVKLAARPEILREQRSIKTFLCRAVINLGIDRHRREQFETTLFAPYTGQEDRLAAETTAPEAALDARARLAVLRQAIGELPARRRAVFVLHRLDGLSPDQIAARLNITRNMVDRHLRKAMVHCLDRLADLD